MTDFAVVERRRRPNSFFAADGHLSLSNFLLHFDPSNRWHQWSSSVVELSWEGESLWYRSCQCIFSLVLGLSTVCRSTTNNPIARKRWDRSAVLITEVASVSRYFSLLSVCLCHRVIGGKYSVADWLERRKKVGQVGTVPVERKRENNFFPLLFIIILSAAAVADCHLTNCRIVAALPLTQWI